MSLPVMPYKGLMPYSEEDSVFFFGREPEQEIITANLMASRLTLLYGASGVGKSSVLRAGVSNHIRKLTKQNLTEHGTPEFIGVVFSSWRDDPVASLCARVHDAVSYTLNGTLGDPPPKSHSLVQTLHAWTSKIGGDLLIILDQFEEYFLYHSQEDGDGTFATEFPRALNRPDLRVSFLISIREDALAKLDRFKGRVPNLFDNYLRIEHLDRDAARDAIKLPIARYNQLYSSNGDQVEIEADLVEAVLDQVRTGNVSIGETGCGVIDSEAPDKQIETPYLQLVMERLWNEEQQDHSRTLRLETLNRLRGAERIVKTHLDGAMNTLQPEEQNIASRVFHYLVTPSGTKIAHSTPDLAEYAGLLDGQLTPVLENLAGDVRILRAVTPPNHIAATRYEIFHDVLASAILDWRARYVNEQQLLETEKRAATEAAEAEKEGNRRRQLEQALALAAEQQLRAEAERGRALEQEQRVAEQGHAARRLGRLVQLLVVVSVLALAAAAGTLVLSRKAEQRSKETEQQRQIAEEQRAIAERQELLALQEREEADEARRVAERQTRLATERSRFAEAQRSYAEEQKGIADQRRQKVELLTQVARAGQDAKDIRTAQGPVLFAIEAARRSAEPFLETDQVLRQGLASLPRLLSEPKAIGTPQTSNGSVSDIAFTTTGRYIVTGNSDGTLRVADASSGQEVWSGKHDDAVNAVSVNPSARYVATASSDRTVKVWEIVGGKVASILKHDGRVKSVTFSPDGKYLATGGDDMVARLWDVSSAKELTRMSTTAGVSIVAFSPDGRILAIACKDGTARLWEHARGTQVVDLKHRDGVRTFAFSSDGRYFATAGGDNCVRLWSGISGAQIIDPNAWEPSRQGSPETDRQLRMAHPAAIMSLAFSRDGRYLATGSVDGKARVWTVGSARLPAQMQHGDKVTSVAFNPDGRYLAAASADSTVRIWDIANGQQLARITHEASVTALAIRPDWVYLATASADGRTQVWQVLSGAEVARVSHPGPTTIAFRENELILAGSARRRLGVLTLTPGSVQVWRLEDGKQNTKFDNFRFDQSVGKVALGPTHIATANKDLSAHVYDLRSGKEVSSMSLGQRPDAIALSANAQFLATATAAGTVLIWDATGPNRLLGSIGVQSGLDQVALSDDGKYLATASENSVRIWDWRKQSEVTRLNEINSTISLAFSPDGRYLATASQGESVLRLWDHKSRREVGRIDVGRTDQPGQVIAIAFGESNGKGLIGTVGVDGVARVWLWRPPDVIAELCTRLNRNMTGEEWLKYMGNQPYQLTCGKLRADPGLIDAGLSLAADGEIKGAVTLFQAANRFDSNNDTDSDLKRNPEAYARRIDALARASYYAQIGKIKEAVRLYSETAQLKLKSISPASWNHLCWAGGLWNQPDYVIGACEKAVNLAPGVAPYADSRGLVKALLAFRGQRTGDAKHRLIEESIKDFESYVKSNAAMRSTRIKWIEELRSGRNPFTPDELARLRQYETAWRSNYQLTFER